MCLLTTPTTYWSGDLNGHAGAIIVLDFIHHYFELYLSRGSVA
jgi:hypothetical protein